MYRIKQYRIDSLKTISGYFGNIHYSTVGNGIARAKRKIEKGENYHRDLDDVKKSLLMLQEKT